MRSSKFNIEGVIDERSIHLERLTRYRHRVRGIVEEGTKDVPEAVFIAGYEEDIVEQIDREVERMGEIRHLIIVGIGGSNLGAEAIHHALPSEGVELHVLDCVSSKKLSELFDTLSDVSLEQFAICVISKSGGTTETLANAEMLMGKLKEKYGDAVNQRIIYIGNEGNALAQSFETLGASVLSMPEVVGGRYSVFTSVGLLPLALAGHDIRAILKGFSQTCKEEHEEYSAHEAALLYAYMTRGYRVLNFFTFDTRLEKLGYWCRQLVAESLGKEFDVDDKKVDTGYIPTVSTVVDLHSVGQLYFSGFSGIYTDFMSTDEEGIDFELPETPTFAQTLAHKKFSDVRKAIETGVLQAYAQRKLPHRHQVLPNASLEEALGAYMGYRMLETVYLAHLMNVNPFDQPNVELYKDITRSILTP